MSSKLHDLVALAHEPSSERRRELLRQDRVAEHHRYDLSKARIAPAKRDALLLSGGATATTPVATNDVCFVKLNVGPGNAGPAGAPSRAIACMCILSPAGAACRPAVAAAPAVAAPVVQL